MTSTAPIEDKRHDAEVVRGNAWVLAARPKTLPAAVVPVVLGSALAFNHGGFRLLPAAVCLAFALLIQVGTNFANDYFDFVKGADTKHRIGPTRAVAAGLVSPGRMRAATVLVFLLASAVGCLLIPYGGAWLVLIGVLSVLCGVAYTGGPYPLGYNGWGDVFVFLFFGLVATGLTYYVQAGAWSTDAWILGCAPGALASNILMVNNLRDVETDRLAGKRTIVVRFGTRLGEWLYATMWMVAFGASLLLAWRMGSVWPLLPWLLGGWSMQLWVMVRRSQGRGARRWGYLLGATASLMTCFGLLLAGGIIAAGL